MQHAGKTIGIRFTSGEQFEFAQMILRKDRKSDRIFIPFDDKVLFIDKAQQELLDISGVSYKPFKN